MGRLVDKYLVGDFFSNIVIHNTISMCDRVADRGTRDPEWVLRLYHLMGSLVVLI